MKKVISKILLLFFLLIYISSQTFTFATYKKSDSRVSGSRKLDKITISTPVAYIIEKGLLKDYTDRVELVIWGSNDQFRAQVLNGSVDFVTMPVNAAALFYNKGVRSKMLKVAMWKLFYIVSKDDRIKTIRDLKGRKVVIPFRGDVPDTLFQYLCAAEKLDPFKDMNIQYVPSLLDTTTSIIGGQADCTLMIEPAASMAVIKAREKKIVLKRVIDLQAEWCKYSGISGGIMPISGVAVLPRFVNQSQVFAAFTTAISSPIFKMESAGGCSVLWVRQGLLCRRS